MDSNSGERWLISITDMPEPRQSSNSSRMRSSTASGSAAGPALKLKTRFRAGAVTREDTVVSPEGLAGPFFLCTSARYCRAANGLATHKNITLHWWHRICTCAMKVDVKCARGYQPMKRRELLRKAGLAA